MDKQWFNKCRKAHANILRCIEEAYRVKNIDVMLTNVKRLNDLTVHYQITIGININQNMLLELENRELEAENKLIRDESFLSISESKGRYKEAKEMLNEFYGTEGD